MRSRGRTIGATLAAIAGIALFGGSGAMAAAPDNGLSGPNASAEPSFSIQSTVPLGGPWQEFSFGELGTFAEACTGCAPSSGGNSEYAGDPPWTFSSYVPVRLTVTDAFLIEDRFEVFDNGVSLGLTSDPVAGDECGDDPEICIADPRVSSRVWVLAPGEHSITIKVNEGDFGAAYFRLDEEVSESCDLYQSPAGCWRFDEPFGTTAIDSSGNLNDGTYLGGATLGAAGLFGGDTAVSLDGVNDLVRVPDSASLDVGDSFAATGFIKRSSTSKTHAMFNKGGGGLHIVVMNAGAGSQVFLRKANGTTLARSNGGIPADGNFHHVAVSFNGPGTAEIYIDGSYDTVQVNTLQTIVDTALPLYFGTTGTTQATYNEFALYDEPYSIQALRK